MLLMGMSLGPDLLKKVNKKFEPSSTIPLRYRRYDLVLVTDKEGNAMQLFFGQADERGRIRGERYARTIVYDKEGKRIRDHWDLKGRTH